MKVNYVLMYGTPYLKYREFEKFDDISKFLINKGIVNYRIFELMEDKKEVEMIYLQNDVKFLEKRIDKAIKYIKKCMKTTLKINDYWTNELVNGNKLLEILGSDK